MPEELCSSRLPDWLQTSDLRISSLKMFPDCFRMTKAGRFTPSSVRYLSWGTVWNGKCLTARILESGNIFKDEIRRSLVCNQSGNLEEQSSSGICKSFPLSGDRECLARKSCTQKIKVRHSFSFDCSCVIAKPLPFCVEQQSVVLIRISIHLAVSHTGKTACTS